MSAPAHAIAGQHPHPQTNTGVSNGLLGIMCFLVSEMALFGSLIFMYLYQRRSYRFPNGSGISMWPPHGFGSLEWQYPLVNTVILLSSGVTMHFAFQALRRDDRRRMLILLIATIVLGVAFLGGQAYEYTTLITVDHWTMNENIYPATFFTLTGLHGLHVSGGVVFLLVILVRTLKGDFSSRDRIVPHAATLYWHFVDAVWVILFSMFYLTVPA
jgi:heme/copper-type cytochrome/quinol oxidase subunit 3